MLNLVSRACTLSVMITSQPVNSALDSRKHKPAIRSTFLACVSIVMGCSVPPPVVVEKAVIVERQIRVPLPPDLIEPCVGQPEKTLEAPTNGDLLVNRRQWIEYASCLDSKLHQVRSVQP